MKIFITGGTGFVGKELTHSLLNQGHEVTVLGHRHGMREIHDSLNVVTADSTERGEWQDIVSLQDVVINLAGASIFNRWTKKWKEVMYKSRVHTTRYVVEGMAKSKKKNRLLISTSATGYYGYRDDTILTEGDSSSDDFLSLLARDWEAEALKAEDFGVRAVVTRFGVVLGKGGGALQQLVKSVNLRAGSHIGSGTQYFSWIHMDDLVRIINEVLTNKKINSPINCTAPEPVTNRELMSAIRKILKKPALIPPAPELAMKLLLGEFGEFLCNGQRVMPQRLLDSGFTFSHNTLDSALKDLLKANESITS